MSQCPLSFLLVLQVFHFFFSFRLSIFFILQNDPILFLSFKFAFSFLSHQIFISFCTSDFPFLFMLQNFPFSFFSSKFPFPFCPSDFPSFYLLGFSFLTFLQIYLFFLSFKISIGESQNLPFPLGLAQKRIIFTAKKMDCDSLFDTIPKNRRPQMPSPD